MEIESPNKKRFVFWGSTILGSVVFLASLLTLATTISAAQWGIINDASVGTATGVNEFTPNIINIEEGESVTFTNTGQGYHNLVFDSTVPGGSVPDGFTTESPSTSEWSVTIDFGEPGTYYFYCDPHFDPTTQTGMAGRIVVSASSGGPGTVPTRTPFPNEEAIFLPVIINE